MKKLSNIDESIWSDLQDRSSGALVRKEDYKYGEWFSKIKEMELLHPSISWHSGLDFIWTPCNFGAESYDQPGLYLNSEEIIELGNFLENTDYEIAGYSAFGMLGNRRFEKKKIGKWWYYIFVCDDDKELYIPNFGVYAEGDPNNLLKPTKDSLTYYGGVHKSGAEYTAIKNRGKSLDCQTYINSNQTSESDRFQVRLVKKILS